MTPATATASEHRATASTYGPTRSAHPQAGFPLRQSHATCHGSPSLRQRSPSYESAFLAYVEMLSEHLTKRPPDGALHRLMAEREAGLGTRDYGNASFLNDQRNLPHEAREELADATFYYMADAEKHDDQPGDEAFHLLAEAAAHVAAADLLTRRVEHLRHN